MIAGDDRGGRGTVPRRSPNHGARRGGARADMVVLHYTGMASAGAALARLCAPAAQVSAHYLIDLDGTVIALVPEARRAWHAGVARWGDVDDVNSRSVGIELANPGLGDAAHPFPQPQMLALERLLGEILARHGIAPERVVGHACIAPGRKRDPGPRFDWRRLARSGLSVWPGMGPHAPPPPDPGGSGGGGTRGPGCAARFRAAAARFGYPIAAEGEWDAPSEAVWRAFAERFCPRLADRPGDGTGLDLIEALAACWPVALDAPAAQG